MDVLYPVKDHENNHELRHSLRSLKNIERDRVFIVGFKPSWVNDKVLHIPVEQNPMENKYIKSIQNLIEACKDPRLSNKFILMNDDFFILRKLNKIPVLHRGKLRKMIDFYYQYYPNSPYTQGLLRTFRELQELGIEDPLSYELHAPMVLDKYEFAKILEISLKLEGFGKRTLYGNLLNIGGHYFEDPKYTNPKKPIFTDMPFVSTDEGSFMYHPIGEYIRELFKEESMYEVKADWIA